MKNSYIKNLGQSELNFFLSFIKRFQNFKMSLRWPQNVILFIEYNI